MKKVAIVTGASSGMGREISVLIDRVFQNLDEIWVVARRKERLEELALSLNGKCRILMLDLSFREDILELERQLFIQKVDVKILVNAAGFGMIGKVGQVFFEEEMNMVRLNCEGLTGVTHVVLPFMGEGGRVIQFASSAAFLPQPKFAIYAATKSYVLSYSRALGVELFKRGIYVTCVCPGPVLTEFFQVAQAYEKPNPFKRFFMANPKKVVKKALEDSRKGKALSIYGISMNCVHVIGKFIPHGFLLQVMKVFS